MNTRRLSARLKRLEPVRQSLPPLGIRIIAVSPDGTTRVLQEIVIQRNPKDYPTNRKFARVYR